MKIAVINYNAGNIYSVMHALRRIGIEPLLTNKTDEIMSADKVIFPGVGEATKTMKFLEESGLGNIIKELKQPVLGICLGMQLMCQHSEEGNVKCLGIFDTTVKKFQARNKEKIPHMGWNQITDLKTSLFQKTKNNDFVYFVHSYYVPVCENTIATTNYIDNFSAALNKNNFYACQFHPEKSGDIGSTILEQFINL